MSTSIKVQFIIPEEALLEDFTEDSPMGDIIKFVEKHLGSDPMKWHINDQGTIGGVNLAENDLVMIKYEVPVQ